MDAPPRPQDVTSEVIAKWNRDYFNPRYAMACLCHEYLLEFPYSPRFAIYLVDLGRTSDGQPMPLRNNIFNTTPEGLSRIDIVDQPEPRSSRKRMLGRMAPPAPRASEPRQLGERVRFEPTCPSRDPRPSPERTHRRRSRSGHRERQPSSTPVPVTAWPAPSLDPWSSSATTNPPVLYGEDYGRPGSHRHLHDQRSESRRARYPVRHMEQSSSQEAARAVPVPSVPDIRLHDSAPLSPRWSADSASSLNTNPQHVISRGSVREQSRQSERPESSGSYSRPTQSYATDAYYPPSDPVGRQSNAELEQKSHSSRDSFHTASPPHPLPPTLSHPQLVIQNPSFTDNSRDGSFGGQDPWSHQAHAWNASTEPGRASARYDSYHETIPPSPRPPPHVTAEVERREESTSAPQAMVKLSPLEGQ